MKARAAPVNIGAIAGDLAELQADSLSADAWDQQLREGRWLPLARLARCRVAPTVAFAALVSALRDPLRHAHGPLDRQAPLSAIEGFM